MNEPIIQPPIPDSEQSAFPTIIYDTNAAGDSHPREIYPGLTKRELFAAMAMQAFCSKQGCVPQPDAECAVKWADALIKELKRK